MELLSGITRGYLRNLVDSGDLARLEPLTRVLLASRRLRRPVP